MEIKIAIHDKDERGDVFCTTTRQTIVFRGRKFVVPRGFESDGVSVPEFLWGLVSPAMDPRTLRAGIAHDYLYREQPEGWTRSESDLLFLCFCLEDGLSIARAFKAYAGLRLFGWLAWRKNRSKRNDRF